MEINHQIIVYDISTGMIKFTVDPPYTQETLEFHLQQVTSNLNIGVVELPQENIIDKYINNNQLTDRPLMDIEVLPSNTVTLGEVIYLSNIPVGSKLFLDDEVYTMEDNELSLSLSTRGKYSLRFIKAPYQSTFIEIVVV